MTTTTKTIDIADLTADTGRSIDWMQLKVQIGARTVCAISGGRAERWGRSTIALPVSSGYRVTVTLEANDTYTVRRVMKRGAKMFVKGTVTDVYADQVSDVAYVASCYRNLEFGQ